MKYVYIEVIVMKKKKITFVACLSLGAALGYVDVGVSGVVASITVNVFFAVTKHVGLVSAALLTEEKVDELVAVLSVSIGLDKGVCACSRCGNGHGNEHSAEHGERENDRKNLFHLFVPFVKLDW